MTSAERVRFYSHQIQHGSPSPAQTDAAEGRVGYVVDAYGTRAIEGEHSSVRYMEATIYWDALDDRTPVSPDDQSWQRASHSESNSRRLARAEFREEHPGGYRTDGFVTARIERDSDGRGRCVSFSYFVGTTFRGAFPCTTSGPPKAIVIDGVANWVFAPR